MLSVDADVPVGTYMVELDAANDDASPQTGSCTTTVTVQEELRVSDVQGQVTDLDSGPDHRSPLAPTSGNGTSSTLYFVRGVIAQKTLARTSTGGSQNGFFLQDTLARSDDDPTTSDGIFVFMGALHVADRRLRAARRRRGDPPRARLRVLRHDRALQRVARPQLVSPMLDVDVVAPASEANPPDDLADAGRYWERREGMRGRVPAGAVVTGGRDVFASTADSELWLIRGDSAVAQRTDPYARRAFRDAHPLDNEPGARRRRQRVSHPARAAGREGDGRRQPDAAPAGTRVRHARRRRRRRRRLLVRQVPHQPGAAARAHPGGRPLAERAAPVVRARRRVQRRELQRREPLRLPRRPVRRLRLHRERRAAPA